MKEEAKTSHDDRLREAPRSADAVAGHSPLPWEISGATIIWSPTGHANVAAVSDPRPPDSFSVGYYPVPYEKNRFDEACANAELILKAVNNHESLVASLRALTSATIDAFDIDFRGSLTDLRTASAKATAVLEQIEK